MATTIHDAATQAVTLSSDDLVIATRMERLFHADDVQGQIALGRTLDWTNPGGVLNLYTALFAMYRQSEKGEFLNGVFGLLKLVDQQEAVVVTRMPRLQLALMLIQLIQMVEAWMFSGRIRLAGQGHATLHGAARQALRLAESDPEAVELVPAAHRLLKRFMGAEVKDTAIHFLRPDTPYTLQVEPTNACNLKCTMCPRTLAMTRPVAHMPADVFAGLLDGWSGRLRQRQLRHIVYGGSWTMVARGQVKLFYLGEIFEHPQFDDIISITARSGATPLVQTNGVHLVKRSVRRRLLEAAPPSLGISLDGVSEDTYNAVRNGSNWKGVVDAIRALRDERKALGLEGVVKLHVTTILPDETPETRETVTAFLAPVAECVEEVRFIRLGRAHTPEFFDKNGRMRAMEAAGGECWMDIVGRLPTDEPSCFEPLNKLNVLSDGTVTPCCVDINADLKLGTVAEGIDAVWNAEPTRSLHMAHLTHDLRNHSRCQECIVAGQPVDL